MGKEQGKGYEPVRRTVAPILGAGGSLLQATLMHEERQQLRPHERKTQDYEVNEAQLERETSEDEGHVIRS